MNVSVYPQCSLTDKQFIYCPGYRISINFLCFECLWVEVDTTKPCIKEITCLLCSIEGRRYFDRGSCSLLCLWNLTGDSAFLVEKWHLV